MVRVNADDAPEPATPSPDERQENCRLCYERIQRDGLLTRGRMDIYEFLYRHLHEPPMTGGEIFLALQHIRPRGEGRTLVKGSVCARLTELERQQAVQIVGSRVCRLTGHRATLWSVTGEVSTLPPVAKARSRKRLERALELAEAALERLGALADLEAVRAA